MPASALSRFGLANWKVSTRILAGFLSVLVLVAAIGAAGIYSLVKTEIRFRDFSREAALTTQLLQIQNDIGDFTRNTHQYVAGGNRADLDAAAQAKSRLDQEAADVISHSGGGVQAATVRQLQDSIAAYNEGLQQIAHLRERQRTTIATVLLPKGTVLDKAGKAMDEAAKKANELSGSAFAEVVEQQFAAMAALVDKYIHEPEATTAKQVDDTAKKLKDSINEVASEVDSPEIKKMSADMAAVFAVYAEGFDDLAAVAPAINETVDGVMAINGKGMADAAQQIRAVAVQAQAHLQAVTEADIARSQKLMAGLALAGVLIGLGLAWWIGRGINRPMRAMIEIMGRLAAGDKSVEIVALEKQDEIGEMARAVDVFKRNAIENERLQRERETAEASERSRAEEQRLAEARQREAEARREREAIAAHAEEEARRHKADEERERAASEQRRRERNQLAESFEATVKGVVGAVSTAAAEMQSTASSMAQTAERTSQQTASVAAASEEATRNVQTVAAATEELSASVGEIGRQVAQSTKIAEKAVEEAQRTNTTVKGLAEAAEKIGKVVEMINGIAGQTNLLALNATIEAARAGEAGKGFAVVASEVKSLANQTAKATEEIASQISGMQRVTAETVSAIEGIGTTIQEISQIATAIAAAIEEQDAATHEIARNVQQTAVGTQEVSGTITGVTRATGETGDAANLVLKSAAELARQSELLRNEVDRFVNQIRSA